MAFIIPDSRSRKNIRPQVILYSIVALDSIGLGTTPTLLHWHVFLQGGPHGRNKTADSGYSHSLGPALSLFRHSGFRAGTGHDAGPFFRAHHPWRHARPHSLLFADFAGGRPSDHGAQRAHVRAQGAGSRHSPGRAGAAHAASARALAFAHS